MPRARVSALLLVLAACASGAENTSGFTSVTMTGMTAATAGSGMTSPLEPTTSATDTDGTGTASAGPTTEATTTETIGESTTDSGSTGPGPGCGDGVLDPTEECDDGNLDPGDGCSPTCTSETCGNAIVEPGEGCDDGNANDNDACPSNCVPASCGDGFILAGNEECDDGNTDDNDACLSTCVPASCGDGFIFAGNEECDDGNADDTDACLSTCKAATCGDGVVHAGVEACDGEPIANGMCTNCAVACNPNFGDCNTNPGDGCEVNTLSDPNNCGMCGNACGPNEQCAAGTCQPQVFEYGPEHTFEGLQSNHFITQGCCSVNCAGNSAVDAAYFCQHFYGNNCTPKPGYFIAQTPFPTYPKMHKNGGCTGNGLNIPNTTCDGGPCKIGDWNETTSGLTNLVCVCQ